MSDLQNRIENTKSLEEITNVFNKENDQILDNIGNYKYSDVVKHLDNLMMSLVKAKEEGKITWDMGPLGNSAIEKFGYYNLNTKVRQHIALKMYEYADNKLKNKPVESNNFREVIIRTLTEFGKFSSRPEPDTLMSEKVDFSSKNEPLEINVSPVSKSEYVRKPDPVPTEKLQTNIDSQSELQKEIAKTKSMEDLAKVFNKELDKTLPEIENKKYSDLVKSVDSLMMNLVHAVQEGNLSWYPDNGKFSWSDHSLTYNNLNSEFTQKITSTMYTHVESELLKDNKLVELSNYREVLIRTITGYGKLSPRPEPDTLMSEKVNFNIESTVNRLQNTLEKLRGNESGAEKKNGLKNN